MVRLGSFDDLHTKMKLVFEKDPHNPYAWMGMFYSYYMLNGQTYLGKLDDVRYPSVVPMTTEDFMKSHPRAELGKTAFI